MLRDIRRNLSRIMKIFKNTGRKKLRFKECDSNLILNYVQDARESSNLWLDNFLALKGGLLK